CLLHRPGARADHHRGVRRRARGDRSRPPADHRLRGERRRCRRLRGQHGRSAGRRARPTIAPARRLVEGCSQMITRRAALAGAIALPLAARAQAKFPERPIKLIIPWAAGGPADAGFRIIAESAAKKFGQPVVVENKAGASGVLGAMALQDAKPDGYVISQMHMSVLRQPLLNKSLTYNPISDLTYILQVTGYVMGVVVRTEAPWK